MSLSRGARLGLYEVTVKIGEDGRARSIRPGTRLDVAQELG